MMFQDFFQYLPSEIIISILSRLPVRTIIHCKCVCKSWLDLLETHEFAKSHLSKSVPGLAIFQDDVLSKLYKIYEFEDVLDLGKHELHYSPVTNFTFPYHALLQGSANGLLFLGDLRGFRPCGLFICNPVTRDCIEIQCPQEFVYSYPKVVTFGFGASKITGQHKLVRMFHDCVLDRETKKLVSLRKSECQVYTLGTGSWRSIAPGTPFKYNRRSAFLNGNLHWFALDLNIPPGYLALILKQNFFSTFSTPLSHIERFLADVFALGDCLCLCDNSSDNDIVIWLMKEYGVEKSWTKEFVISKIPHYAGESYEVVHPIKVFKDGDILMAWEDFSLFYYSNKTKTIMNIDMFEPQGSILHTSSFLSLTSFAMEDVRSF